MFISCVARTIRVNIIPIVPTVLLYLATTTYSTTSATDLLGRVPPIGLILVAINCY